jgi:hypothetical protein
MCIEKNYHTHHSIASCFKIFTKKLLFVIEDVKKGNWIFREKLVGRAFGIRVPSLPAVLI